MIMRCILGGLGLAALVVAEQGTVVQSLLLCLFGAVFLAVAFEL
jgi:hypothetical protein